jgi:hypothetical protein
MSAAGGVIELVFGIKADRLSVETMTKHRDARSEIGGGRFG